MIRGGEDRSAIRAPNARLPLEELKGKVVRHFSKRCEACRILLGDVRDVE